MFPIYLHLTPLIIWGRKIVWHAWLIFSRKVSMYESELPQKCLFRRDLSRRQQKKLEKTIKKYYKAISDQPESFIFRIQFTDVLSGKVWEYRNISFLHTFNRHLQQTALKLYCLLNYGPCHEYVFVLLEKRLTKKRQGRKQRRPRLKQQQTLTNTASFFFSSVGLVNVWWKIPRFLFFFCCRVLQRTPLLHRRSKQCFSLLLQSFITVALGIAVGITS